MYSRCFGNSAPAGSRSGGTQAPLVCAFGRRSGPSGWLWGNRPSTNIWVGAYTLNRFAVAWAQVLLIRCLSKDIGRLGSRVATKIPRLEESPSIPPPASFPTQPDFPNECVRREPAHWPPCIAAPRCVSAVHGRHTAWPGGRFPPAACPFRLRPWSLVRPTVQARKAQTFRS